MKKWSKILAVVLVLLLSVVSPIAVFADDRSDESVGDNTVQVSIETDSDEDGNIDEEQDEENDADEEIDEEQNEENDVDEEIEEDEDEENDADEEVDEDKDEEKDLDEDKNEALEEQGEDQEEKLWETAKNALEQEKDAIEDLKDQVEEQIEELEKQCEEAERSENPALVDSLKKQIAELKAQKDAYKAQMKSKIEQMKEVMKKNYSTEELEALKAVSAKLDSIPNVTVLPVENVLVSNADVKFDTPPVIKEGRTLIPVRAISEATGALVEWNAEEKKVTITKGEQEIILIPGENKVYVNNTSVVIDVPAQVMNSRTMVPLRFISENLGLTVEWDSETQSIEIK